ncbi:unnamed protein product [Auanema sp. JU1783]|nr:unnamed protein product [Auanema sp. JU1783]
MIEESTYEKPHSNSDAFKFDESDIPGSSSSISSDSPISSSTTTSITSLDITNESKLTHSTNSSAPSSEPRKKKPYKELTLEEKVQLIRLAEDNAGLSQAAIAERYKIAKSNVCRILQRKSEYLTAYESAGFAGNRKRKLKAEDAKTSANVSSTSSSNSLLDHQMTSSSSSGLLVPAPFDGMLFSNFYFNSTSNI